MSESSKEIGAGRVSFLAEEQKQRIYETALGILADIGMVVLHEEGEQVMLDGGCTKDGDGNVHVPAALVESEARFHRVVDVAPEAIVEHVRIRLSQQICGDLVDNGALNVLRLGKHLKKIEARTDRLEGNDFKWIDGKAGFRLSGLGRCSAWCVSFR